MKRLFLILSIVSLVFASGCNQVGTCSSQPKNTEQVKNISLTDFMVKSGDFITQKSFPAYIESSVLVNSLRNSLLLDIRDSNDFNIGHIENAKNISADKLMDYLKNNPTFAYNKIVIIDQFGPQSVYIATLLRYLGYNNVFGLKYGMSFWNKAINKNIAVNFSNKYADQIDQTPVQKPKAGQLPVLPNIDISTLLNQRIADLIKLPASSYILSADEFFAHKDQYFVINYWTSDQYNQGHIKGAYDYIPRSDLSSVNLLNTLPKDKKIMVYCHTGHTAAAVVAYLRLLGYDAFTLMYGANSFMNQKFAEISPAAAIIDVNAAINDFPIVTKSAK